MILEWFYCIIFFLYGIIIGSFLNVCMIRIPKKENIVVTRSHCMSCGYQLKWYDLIPFFSYLILGGKCRECKDKISVQYPVIEVLNGLLYVIIFLNNGLHLETILSCLLTSALLVLSIIDFRTYEIPALINLFIGILAIVRVILDYKNTSQYLFGFISVSGFLLLIFLISKGRAIGGGDIKLMSVCGLFLGYQRIILAFLLGCILGSLIHIIRMKVSKQDRVLAFGPYLSLGIFISMLYGNQLIHWYLDSLIR